MKSWKGHAVCRRKNKGEVLNVAISSEAKSLVELGLNTAEIALLRSPINKSEIKS